MARRKLQALLSVTAKAKSVFVHALKAYELSGGIAPRTNRKKMSGQSHQPATSPPAKDPLNIRLIEYLILTKIKCNDEINNCGKLTF
jgi:hypothetical protein